MKTMEKEEILTPVGRLVSGSLYEGNTKDFYGNDLVYKSGKHAGEIRKTFFFGLAIRKKGEKHWNETSWGKKIWDKAHRDFRNGLADSTNFAWKIIDGDSEIPNSKGKKPCEFEGFKDHWVLKLTSSFQTSICDRTGDQEIIQKDFVNLGDYIQVCIQVVGNGEAQKPGIYLNPVKVAFSGYGKRIVYARDSKDFGFGQEPLPEGCSNEPVNEYHHAKQEEEYTHDEDIDVNMGKTDGSYTDILSTPPPPPAPSQNVAKPGYIMTEKANGLFYQKYVDRGWSDAQLLAEGLMKKV